VVGDSATALPSFYEVFTPVCFTLVGLWLIVVQTRHGEWRGSAVHRSRAYTLAASFSLPGMMGLLSLVDPGDKTLWRASFACVAICGAAASVWLAVWGPGRGKHPPAALFVMWLATLVYVVVALVAIVPTLVHDIGFSLTPLEVEAILLSILVFAAVNVAFVLMFDDVDEGDPERAVVTAGDR
jgi:hypothetical protein